MRYLILGGARSGKSAFAENLAMQLEQAALRRQAECAGVPQPQVIYLATAQAGDAEMQERIGHHQSRRPAHWQLHEESLALAQSLRALDQPGRIIVLDCLTLWLSNLLFADGREYPEIGQIQAPTCFAQQRGEFLQTLPTLQADLVIVSNEVGMGIVPLSAVTRWFADEAGRLNQAVAALAEEVVLVAAGLPLYLKRATALPEQTVQSALPEPSSLS